MNIQQKNQVNTSSKAALVISGQTAIPDKEIVERLSRRGWLIRGRTASVEKALEEITAKRATTLIIEDTKELPVQLVLRQLIATKIGLLTPTLVICNPDNYKEIHCLSTIGTPTVMEGPATPLTFIEHFELLLKKWTTSHLSALLGVRSLIMAGKNQDAIRQLAVLTKSEDSDITSVAGPCMALFLRMQNQRAAEKLLLDLLEKSKNNMGIIFALVDLYQASAMPGYALRLLNTVGTMYGRPKAVMVDLLQTHQMLNNIEHLIHTLRRMQKENYLIGKVNAYLPRLLLTQGNFEDFEAMARGSSKEHHLLAWGLQAKEGKRVG